MATPLVMKQVVSVIDRRTTTVCLHAAGQIRKLEDPFDTLLGEQDDTPFHVHCRSFVAPWMPGFVNDLRREANAELLRRPLKERRIGPGGQTGPLPPRAPDGPSLPGGAQASQIDLDRVMQANGVAPQSPIASVPPEARKAFIEAYSERFEMTSNGGGISETYWVKDLQTGDRYVLKAGQYHNESAAEVIGTRLQHEVGFKSEVLVSSDMASGNGWVLLKHAEDIDDHKAAGYKVVGTSGSHGAQGKLLPRMENPEEAVKKLVTDFAIDEADAKGGNMLLLSRDGGKTVRLAPIDRSLSQMGWREAVEPGKTSVVAGDWSLAGRLKVTDLKAYMKTRGSPKGVLDLVQSIADTADGQALIIRAYDDALAALKRIDMADLTRGLPADLVAENVALIRRRIDLLESKRDTMLAQMGVKKIPKPDPPPVVADTWSAARDSGHSWLQDVAERPLPTGGRVSGSRWIGDSIGDTVEEFREQAPNWAEVYDRTAATLGTLVDEFPDAMRRISFVRMSQNPNNPAFAYYRPGTGDITVNLSQMGDLATAQRRYDHARSIGYYADADGSDIVMGVVAHEVGHHLDSMLKQVTRKAIGHDRNDPWPTMWRRIGEEMRKVDGKVKSGTAARKVENLKRYGKDLVSDYGARNEHEFIAEAFTEYMTSPNPRPVARIVGEAFYDAFGAKADDVAASTIQFGRLRRGPDIDRTVKEVAQEAPPPVASEAAVRGEIPPPGPLKVLNSEDHLVMAAWQTSVDPRVRGVAVWQESYAGLQAVRQVVRNVDAGLDPWTGVDLEARWLKGYQSAKVFETFEEAYTVEDMKNDVLNAARVIREMLEAADEVPTLYRGMRVPSVEEVFRPGEVVEANLTSWTSDEQMGRKFAYTVDEGSGKQSDWEQVVMVVRGMKAADLDADGAVQSTYKNMAEHLTDGTVRVVRVYEKDLVKYVEVEPHG